ncbi:HAD family hydrolase [Candidatus Woesearchaeota archaeon]|nr:HAD family hydrolase [Candidatus Woesearchaeota archaeon]
MAQINGVKHIIFDWDGVIADSFEHQHKFFKAACKKFGKTYNIKTIDELREYYKEPFRLMYEDWGFDLDNKEELDALTGYFRKFNDSNHVKLFPNMPSILKELHEKGFSLNIVSSNREFVVHKWMKEHHVDKYFTHVITYDRRTAHREKPAPDLILLCIEKLGARKEECAYIGDQRFDIQAARHAGIRSIAVTWGYGHVTKLIAENPDHTVNKPEELLELFMHP